MGMQATCQLDGCWIEAATSFDPGWNKKLAGDKRFNRRVVIGWEMSIPSPTTCALTFIGEGYAAFREVPGAKPGQVGVSGCLSTIDAAGSQRELSGRWVATFPEPETDLAGDPAVELTLELELVWTW